MLKKHKVATKVRDVVLPPAPTQGVVLLPKNEVCRRTSRSFVTIWKWMQAGTFPRAYDLNGRPAWIEAEVDEWARQLPLRRIKGD